MVVVASGAPVGARVGPEAPLAFERAELRTVIAEIARQPAERSCSIPIRCPAL